MTIIRFRQRIIDAINQSPLSMKQAAAIADMPYRTFIYRAQKMGVYKPNRNHAGRTFPEGGKCSTPLSEILNGEHPTYKTGALKKRLLKESMITEECEWCGIGPVWNGKPIVLELDHKNGINNDHNRDNLRLLCPNCHSQTPTFRGRNKNNGPVAELVDAQR